MMGSSQDHERSAGAAQGTSSLAPRETLEMLFTEDATSARATVHRIAVFDLRHIWEVRTIHAPLPLNTLRRLNTVTWPELRDLRAWAHRTCSELNLLKPGELPSLFYQPHSAAWLRRPDDGLTVCRCPLTDGARSCASTTRRPPVLRLTKTPSEGLTMTTDQLRERVAGLATLMEQKLFDGRAHLGGGMIIDAADLRALLALLSPSPRGEEGGSDVAAEGAPVSGSGLTPPIDMVLFCPKCGLQHVDAPEPEDIWLETSMDVPGRWTNPPHRSHLCRGCGFIWRPADVPTNGVAAITTRGKDDPPLPTTGPAGTGLDRAGEG